MAIKRFLSMCGILHLMEAARRPPVSYTHLDVYKRQVVDDLIYDMIPYYKEKGLEETVNLLKDKYPEQDIREAAEDLDELIKEGKLYTEDIYENYIHDIVAVSYTHLDVYKRQVIRLATLMLSMVSPENSNA